MNEQAPSEKPSPTELHNYVDDNGKCAVCGITAGRLTGYRRGRDGNLRLPSKRQWHRRATEAEAKRGLSWIIRSPGRYGKNQRVVQGKLVLHDVPLHILHAVAFIAAGETQRVAARLAGVQPKSLSRWKARNPALWSMIEQQAVCIAEYFAERAERQASKDRLKQEDGTPKRTVSLPYVGGPLAETSGEGVVLTKFFETAYRPLRLLGCSAATVVQYGTVLRQLDHFAGRPVRLGDLSDELVAGFMAWQLANGRSPHTANKSMRHITALWRLAFKKKLVPEPPSVERIRTPKRIPDAWSLAEFDKLLNTAADTPGVIDDTVPAGHFWLALLLVLYETGLRVGAVMQLERKALDVKTRWLHVPAEVQKHSCDQRFRLHPETLEAVKAVLKAGTSKRLFPWPQRREALYRAMRRILDRAGLPSGRRDLFHKVRRTSATAVADKLGRAAAQDHLGHSAMFVTEMYLDPSKINRVQAADILPRPCMSGRNETGQAVAFQEERRRST